MRKRRIAAVFDETDSIASHVEALIAGAGYDRHAVHRQQRPYLRAVAYRSGRPV